MESISRLSLIRVLRNQLSSMDVRLHPMFFNVFDVTPCTFECNRDEVMLISSYFGWHLHTKEVHSMGLSRHDTIVSVRVRDQFDDPQCSWSSMVWKSSSLSSFDASCITGNERFLGQQETVLRARIPRG